MNKKLIFTLLLAFVLQAFVSTVAGQETWVTYSPSARNYSIMMPATPKEEVKEETSSIGAYTLHTATLMSSDTFFIAVYVDYPSTMRLDVQGEINANRDNFMKGIKSAVLTSEKRITIDGHPGIEFTADVGTTHRVISRVYVVGKRPYHLAALYPMNADGKHATKFLNSFKLLK
jgi:hypothetical protein